jgi:amino acid adenylation domain-containing protein
MPVPEYPLKNLSCSGPQGFRWGGRNESGIEGQQKAENMQTNPYLVHHFLEYSAARHGRKVALVCDGLRLTYGEIDAAANRFARYLVSIGVDRHQRVVIFLDNSVEAVIALFGTLKAGAVFVLPNVTMKSAKLAYILNNCGATTLVAHDSRRRVIEEAMADADGVRHLVWCHHGQPCEAPQGSRRLDSFTQWSDLFVAGDSDAGGRLPAVIDRDLATIIYTSGSTGEPKGVVSAHYNMVAAARSITTYLENVETDIVLNTLPFSFDYGLYQLLMVFLFGGTLVLENSFTYPRVVLERLAVEEVTGFPIVPTMVAMLLQMRDLARFDFRCLRYLTNTGAALPVAHIRSLRKMLPHVRIFSMYGLTECKRVSYLPPEKLDEKPDSVGIPIPNSEVFVVDATGREVAANEVGELVVRGSHVMQGYWNDPVETARVFRPGNRHGEIVLHTGDLFRRDAEGYLYFVSRTDDLIKTRGERVSPKEIENALCALDGVAEAAVVGVPDEVLGKALKAFVVCGRQAHLSEMQVQAYCHKTLEPFMVPKYVEFVEALPKTSSGKIDRKSLH